MGTLPLFFAGLALVATGNGFLKPNISTIVDELMKDYLTDGIDGRLDQIGEDAWQRMLNINVTGTWHACKAAPDFRHSHFGACIIFQIAL